MRASPGQPRPSVLFPFPGANVSYPDPIPCGGDDDSLTIYDGSQMLIRSVDFPDDAPVGNCSWSFDVAANVNVDLMCFVAEVDCSTDNRLVISTSSDNEARLCSTSPLTNQRVSLRTQSINYKLTVSHSVVGGSPIGRLSCLVRGSGGTANPSQQASTDPGPSNPGDGRPQQRASAAGCGITKYKIVGGQDALANEFPWMVFLILGPYGCGGTVINNRWVMTAAHCAVNAAPSTIQVYTGCQTLFTGPTCDPAKTVSRNVVHPFYNVGSQLANDIALLQLTNPISAFSDRIRPVCLPTADVPVPGYQMKASGWGATVTGGSVNNALKKAVVQSISDAQCNQIYGIVISSMLCTTRVTGETCNGDSGGFLGSQRGGLYEQDGIVSFGAGAGCGLGYPNGFTEVRAFLNWINPIIAT